MFIMIKLLNDVINILFIDLNGLKIYLVMFWGFIFIIIMMFVLLIWKIIDDVCGILVMENNDCMIFLILVMIVEW